MDLVPFNYAVLAADVADAVRSHTAEIKAVARRTAEGVIAIGQALIAVKERLGHGTFGRWLEAEFGWSHDTAGRFMQTARLAGENPQIAEFEIDISALYLLAQPSTPTEARAEILERAESGERISVRTVREVLQPAVEEPEDHDEDDDEIIDYVPAPRPPAKASQAARLVPKPSIEPAPDVPTFNELVGFLCRVPHERMTPEEACQISDPDMVAAIDRYFDQALPWIEQWAEAWRMVRNAKRRGEGRAA